MTFPRYFVGFALVFAGTVALASSCSSKGDNGFGDDGSGDDGGGSSTGMTTGMATVGNTTAGGTTTSGTTAGMTTAGMTTGTTTAGTTTATGTTGTTTGTTTTTADCPDAAAPVACSATMAAGAVSLNGSYLASGVAGMGGYAYAYDDMQNDAGGTSTACLDQTALCTSGMTGLTNTSGSHYGAGIGFNLNQAMSTGCASMPINPFTPPAGSIGISYSLSNLPTGGARLAIGNYVNATTGTDYCTTLTAASGVIPWAQFNSQCWVNTPGDFLTGAPTNPIHIEFQLPSAAATGTFDFCVTSVSFATSLTQPEGGTGGSDSGSCGSSCCAPAAGPAATGNGSFTCYTFAQGTPGNKTYCGYQGTETAYTGGGTGACQSQNNTAFTDTIPNVGPPSDYFAAFPGPGGPFGNGALCGMCVNVTYAGKTLMGTIADECPTSTNPLCTIGSNHLDLSASLARDLGIGTGTVMGDPTGVTWEAVACPISSNGGNIEVVWNASGQAYFQNVVWPVKSVSVGGTAMTQNNGFWPVNAGATVMLTDMIGHQITAVMPGTSGGSLGKQFPSTCTNP